MTDRKDFDDVGGRGDGEIEREEGEKLFSEMREEGVDKDSPDGRIMPGYGDPYKHDPDFRGPIHDRSCTDVICCILFIIFLLGMAVVSIIGFARGSPQHLVYPTDSSGDVCGVERYEDKPFLFFFDLVACAKMGPAIVTGCPTEQVCVKQCPKKNYVYLEALRSNDRSSLICVHEVDHSKSPYKEMSVEDLVKKELCAAYYLESGPILNRCVPKIFSQTVNLSQSIMDESGQLQLETAGGEKLTLESIYNGTKSVVKLFKVSGFMEMIFKDVINSFHLILICLVIAAAIACLWIVLLRWVTIVAVWLSLLVFIGLIAFGSGYSFLQYYEMKEMNITKEYGLPTVFKVDFEYYLSQQNTWLAFGIISASIFAIFLIIILFLCSRIMLASRLIAETSVALGYMWSVLFWPAVPFILQFLVIAYWIISSVFIASMGDAEFYNDTVAAASNDVNALLNRVPCNAVNGSMEELCSFVKYGGSTYKRLMLAYMLFMFFWLMNFVSALEQMTLAGSFASYYWAWDKERDVPTFPLLSAMGRSLRYHTGSMAFGSLIIALVQFIRAMLEYVNRKVKRSENSVAKFIMKCMRCCFWCLEKFLRFVNKNAYIVIAVHGNNFCSAAKDGFFLIMRNILRAAVVDKVCDFIMFVSKLMVAGAIGVIAFFWFRGDTPWFKNVVPELNYFLVPVMLVVVGAYVIADCFFDVYSMGVDTLFLCFLEDLERNDGSPEKPYYMSKSKNLRSLLFKPK